jgi:nucleoside-diphosphate-sugar epimerase
MGEDACLFYASHMGVRVCVVRPFNIYGPGQDRRFLIPSIVEQAISPDCEEIVLADLRPLRDFLYVSDLVSLLLRALKLRASGVYNAGSGAAVSIGELAGIVTSITGPKRLCCRDERRDNEILEVRADIRKAQRELNWGPCVSLQEGIRAVVAGHAAQERRS